METARQQLRAIAQYLDQMENPNDAEFIRSIATDLHDAANVCSFYGQEFPSKIIDGCTTTLGNLAVSLNKFNIENK